VEKADLNQKLNLVEVFVGERTWWLGLDERQLDCHRLWTEAVASWSVAADRSPCTYPEITTIPVIVTQKHGSLPRPPAVWCRESRTVTSAIHSDKATQRIGKMPPAKVNSNDPLSRRKLTTVREKLVSGVQLGCWSIISKKNNKYRYVNWQQLHNPEIALDSTYVKLIKCSWVFNLFISYLKYRCHEVSWSTRII